LNVVLLEFSMSPLGKGESVSTYVARSMDVIDASGLDYRANAMGTILEGEWDEVIDVVTRCFRLMSQDCDRVTATIKVDFRRGRTGRLSSKIESVERKLGRKVRT
jgi:uncharacterized protein (TIGR00106 family)